MIRKSRKIQAWSIVLLFVVFEVISSCALFDAAPSETPAQRKRRHEKLKYKMAGLDLIRKNGIASIDIVPMAEEEFRPGIYTYFALEVTLKNGQKLSSKYEHKPFIPRSYYNVSTSDGMIGRDHLTIPYESGRYNDHSFIANIVLKADEPYTFNDTLFFNYKGTRELNFRGHQGKSGYNPGAGFNASNVLVNCIVRYDSILNKKILVAQVLNEIKEVNDVFYLSTKQAKLIVDCSGGQGGKGFDSKGGNGGDAGNIILNFTKESKKYKSLIKPIVKGGLGGVSKGSGNGGKGKKGKKGSVTLNILDSISIKE